MRLQSRRYPPLRAAQSTLKISPMPTHGRALVTGSSGFVAWHLVLRLVAEGVEVIGLDFAEPRQPLPTGVTDLRIDIRDRDLVREAILQHRPEVVYHLAAQASVSVSMREPQVDIETNVIGTLHLAQAAIEAGTRRFVFVSTGGALFGEPDLLPVTEDTTASPASIYGASKYAAERYLGIVVGGSEMQLSVVRPGNIYGPAQNPHGEAGVVAIFTERMLRGEPVTIFGDGSQQRDYVFVDDVVEAAVRGAIGTPATCLIGTGTGTSTQTIFDTLAGLTGYEAPVRYGPERPGDIQRIWLDARHAREVWQWAPQVSLKDGMARTIEWFRARS
jgi:UDP-glucose 4-epimerase